MPLRRDLPMSDEAWLTEHLERYRRSLLVPDVVPQLLELKRLLAATHAAGKKVICAGNGGSAAIASHVAVDLTKTAGIRGVSFNEADLITCFANDYGYERWLEKAIEFYGDAGDLVVLISSSGKSPNMVQAARAAAGKGLTVVTLTGFAPDNPLRALGRLNLWADSTVYNVVETTHQAWLLAVCDLLAAGGGAREPAPEAVLASLEPPAR
jgi:D-sedoheptulose 7-phosphate isomerase